MTPLNVQRNQKLFSNPTGDLKYSATVKLKDHNTIQVADPVATRALVSLMDMYAVLGGAASHFGGPAALAELMSACHGLMFHAAKKSNKNWSELFNFVNDAGHCENGLYALKANYGLAGLSLDSLKKFRSIDSKLTGHGEVHLFPEGVFLSNGPLGSAFPQSQGLAIGDKLSGKNRMTICVISDGACMEGEAKESLAAIPGLAKKSKLNPYLLIISDNNTKLSGRIDKDSFSMQPSFESLSTLGWKVFKLQDGNDLQKSVTCLEEAMEYAWQNPDQAVCIHAKTIKGFGTKKTSESSSGGHGFPLKSPQELPAFISEIYQDKPYPKLFDQWIEELKSIEDKIKSSGVKDEGEKIQVGVAKAMIRLAKEGLPIVSVTSDLPGSTGVAAFCKDFPNQSIDVGVAEANMISTAAGLSKLGFIPIVDTFAQFGVTKGALPLTMAALSEAPVIGIFSHTGFQDAADGASHQALSYLAMLSSIPHVKVHALTCSEEAEALVYQGITQFADTIKSGKTPDSQIFFLGRENFPKSFGHKDYKIGKLQVLLKTTESHSKKVAIVTSGSLVQDAMTAAKKLEDLNIGSIVLNPSCLNHFSIPEFEKHLEECNFQILTLEDHQLIGGMGQMLAHNLVQYFGIKNKVLKIKSLGVQGRFGQSAYKSSELYALHGVDANAIVNAAKSFF